MDPGEKSLSVCCIARPLSQGLGLFIGEAACRELRVLKHDMRGLGVGWLGGGGQWGGLT